MTCLINTTEVITKTKCVVFVAKDVQNQVHFPLIPLFCGSFGQPKKKKKKTQLDQIGPISGMFWSQEVKLFCHFFLFYLCPTLGIACLPKGMKYSFRNVKQSLKRYCSSTNLHTTVNVIWWFRHFLFLLKKKCFSFTFKNVLLFDIEYFVCLNICFSDHRDSNNAFINCFCTQACSEHKESLCTQHLGCLPSCHCTPGGKRLTLVELPFLGSSTGSPCNWRTPKRNK